MTNVLLAQAQEALDDGLLVDMTETPVHGSSRLLPVGAAFVRLTGYVELGKHAGKAPDGKPKPPSMQYILQGHIVGGAGDGADGEPEDYVQDGVFIEKTTYPSNLALGDLARAAKIFKALKGNKPYTSFTQCLGGLYIVPVIHRKTKQDKIYDTLDWEKASLAVDPVTRKAYNYPDVAPSEYKVLLWNRPTIEQWDSIHIEGEWQAKDGKPAESKNKYQNLCQDATDFSGSALENMLMGGDSVIPSLTVEPDTSEEEVLEIPEA